MERVRETGDNQILILCTALPMTNQESLGREFLTLGSVYSSVKWERHYQPKGFREVKSEPSTPMLAGEFAPFSP